MTGVSSAARRCMNSCLRFNQTSNFGIRRTLCSSAGGVKVSHGGSSAVLNLPDPSDPLSNPLATIGDNEMSAEQVYWRKRAESSEPRVYERKVDEDGRAFAVGKRKRSVAKVWLRHGGSSVLVNGRNFVDVFPRVDHRDQVIRPLLVTGKMGKFQVETSVKGGGQTGQAEALRHGIARALQNFGPEMRPVLKKDGLLVRDSRVVECKKYGKKKARKSFQWVKR